MTDRYQISLEDFNALNLDDITLLDIRDRETYNKGHIPQAIHLSNDNIDQFLASADKDELTVICCYHGHSSLEAAHYLAHQGFSQVFSLEGGYEAWLENHNN